MVIIVDIGNTHTHIGVFSHDTLEQVSQVLTKNIQHDRDIQHIFDQFGGARHLQWAGISSVVKQSSKIWIDFFYSHHVKHYCVEPKNLPFKLLVEHPHLVGEDRISNVGYAFYTTKKPVALLDFGTATTLDIVDPHGNFIGGAILPGIKMGLEALSEKTDGLPHVTECVVPLSVIGKNTEENIFSSLFWYIDGVCGLIQRVKKELHLKKIPVVYTGGASQWIKNNLPKSWIYQPHMTLYGIYFLLSKR